ncbi:MAG: SMI1/KNR4 family protein [Chitinophagales bacterium]
MPLSRIEKIKLRLDDLIKLDHSRTIFGSAGHQYTIYPAVEEKVLQEFEKNAGVRLPGDYRSYLNTISNGGAGPFYGLYNFDKAVEDAMEYYYTDDEEDNVVWENINPVHEKDELKKYFAPFPVSTKEVEALININESYEDDEYKTIPLPERVTGIILLCEYGCAGYYFLVVNGEQSGTVWFLQEDDYLNPCNTKGRQWNFYDFIEWWVEDSILELTDPAARFKNEITDPLQKMQLIYDQQGLKEIPDEVYQCKNLRKLMFSRDELKIIPEKLFDLKELRILNLYMNSYETVPDAIGKLEKLTVLDLSYSSNLKTLPVAINKLQHLKKLKLTYCTHLLQLPDEIGALTNLSELYLSYSGINDLPVTIAQLNNLGILHIYSEHIDLEKVFPKIAICKNLHYLTIRETEKLSGIGALKNIKTLVINSNYGDDDFKYTLPGEIANSTIEKLYIADTKLLLPENVGDWTTLTSLYINPQQILKMPPSIRYLKNLKLIQCDAMNNEVEINQKKEIESYLPGVVFRWW